MDVVCRLLCCWLCTRLEWRNDIGIPPYVGDRQRIDYDTSMAQQELLRTGALQLHT